MQLGPKQKKWVEALRSGKYKQGYKRLRSGDHYCCLGVAAEILDLQINPKDVCFKQYEEMGLFGELGQHRDDKCALAGLNDSGHSFTEIANTIEQNPELYFKESL